MNGQHKSGGGVEDEDDEILYSSKFLQRECVGMQSANGHKSMSGSFDDY